MKITPGTQAEVDDMLAHEMRQLTPGELSAELAELGYELDYSLAFYYHNTSNKFHFHARSLDVREIDTKIGFAHIDSRKDDNFRKLQQLRMETFIFHKGQIWHY